MLIGLLSCLTPEKSISPYTWGGYVYMRFSDTEELLPLDDADITLNNLYTDGEYFATQPYEDAQAYWLFEIDTTVEQPIQIRIESPIADPIIWRSDSPNSDSIWLSLFTHHSDYNSLFFEQISPLLPDAIVPLNENTHSHVWGTPIDPEGWDDLDGFVYHRDTDTIYPLYFFSLDEEGNLSLLEAPTDNTILFFFSPNIPPGESELVVHNTDQSKESRTTYRADGGEILSAMYYVLWEESP